MAVASNDRVYAAGALVWRYDGDKPKVLLIHRARHDDYSFAKGKVDPGETLPETAVREVEEETGYRVTLGAPLGIAEYVLPSGRNKEVHYWVAELPEAEFARNKFAPNEEVQELQWVGFKKAAKLLSYARDIELLEALRERVEDGSASSFAVVVVRHAQAAPPLAWPDADETRPLTARGQEQAEQAARILAAFGPTRLLASTAVRCLATLSPLASLRELPLEPVDALAQAARATAAEVDAAVQDAVAAATPVVLCSHSPVIPAVVLAIANFAAAAAEELARYAILSTAECAVFHLRRDNHELVAVETHAPSI